MRVISYGMGAFATQTLIHSHCSSLKKVSQGYKSYSRLCPSNVKRQPVILTEKEKAKIIIKCQNKTYKENSK